MVQLSACAVDLDLAGARVEWRKNLHVELRLALLAGRVQRDDLGAQQVVTRRDAAGQGEVDPSTIVDHAVDPPLARAVQPVLVHLEPLEPRGARAGCVVDLGPAVVLSADLWGEYWGMAQHPHVE